MLDVRVTETSGTALAKDSSSSRGKSSTGIISRRWLFQRMRKFQHRSSLHLRIQPCLERHRHQRGVRTVEDATLRSLYGLISSTISTLSGYCPDEVQSLRISAPESQTGKMFSGVEETIVVAQFFFQFSHSSRG